MQLWNLSSINTIHVKQQQHNVGFFIFKFTRKDMLRNVYINKRHASQCLYIISLLQEGFSHSFNFFVVSKRVFEIFETYFLLTNPFQCYLSLSVWCVCLCVLFIYTISISIICVSQEEPSLIASNQQINDFYKWIIFEKKKHCGK